MHKFNNCIAVVTGAGSGIGKALAQELAKAGAKVAISDIQQNTLETTATQLREQGVTVHQAVLDVSDRDAVFAYADDVCESLGVPNLVINNAGVALASGEFSRTTIEEFEWLMSINFSGVLYGTKAFLHKMQDAEWGHIVNISSLFGLIGVPDQTAYNASKFAVRGMTEALRQELEMANSHISCTSVHPGGIKTNIARNSKPGDLQTDQDKGERQKAIDNFDKVARTTAESAAQQILQAVIKNRRRLLIGADAKILDWIQRHMPNRYPVVLRKLLGMATGGERPLV